MELASQVVQIKPLNVLLMRLVEHFEQKFSVESALNDAKTAIDELTSLDEKYSDSATTLTIVQIQEKM
jgi:chaperonin cofactor prefoldin